MTDHDHELPEWHTALTRRFDSWLQFAERELKRWGTPDAQDLASTIVPNAIVSWSRVPERDPLEFKRYLYTALRRAAHRERQHVKRRRARRSEWPGKRRSDGHDEAPSQRLAREEDAVQLRTLVSRLPRGQRQVLLALLDGVSIARIADRLGISRNAVYCRAWRARRGLQHLAAL